LLKEARKLPVDIESLREPCRRNIEQFRRDFPKTRWLVELLWPMLKLAPVATAVVYTAVTLDPVTGAIVSAADLSNVFWLLLQAPLDKAVGAGLQETVLRPLYDAWLEQRLVQNKSVLERTIAHRILERVNDVLKIEGNLDRCKEVLGEMRSLWLTATDEGSTHAL
jgi:hypothetical protein